VQREDGGWGESNDSYLDPKLAELETSTAFQTAWALLGLMAAGEVKSESVRRGINYLLSAQSSNHLWEEPWFTAPGFPGFSILDITVIQNSSQYGHWRVIAG